MISETDVDRHVSQMVMESAQVLFDAHVPSEIIPAFMCGVPTLVISGADDPIVSWESAARTALYHGAKHIVASDAGHLLHVEQGAERIAHAVLHWLDEMKL